METCSYCGETTDAVVVDCYLTCFNCGHCSEMVNISDEYFMNMPQNEEKKSDYILRFQLDPSINKKNLYDPVKHMLKILRCIEGDHRMTIPHDLIPFLKKTVQPPITYLKVKKALKNFPGGSNYLPHVFYFQHIIQGKFIRFHPKMKNDLKIIYEMIVKYYRSDAFEEKVNIKKLPPVSFTIIQILLWLNKHYILPYDVYEVFPYFRTMKGKQKKTNMKLMETLLNYIKFEWDLETDYAKNPDSNRSQDCK